MDKKMQAIVDGLTEEQRARLARVDAMRSRLSVKIAGVDITGLPSLPPELRKNPQQPEPLGGTAPKRRPRRPG